MKNFFLFLMLSTISIFLSNNAWASSNDLEQEAADKMSAAKSAEGYVAAGNEELKAAQERKSQLIKQINEAELSKFKLDAELQKIQVGYKNTAREADEKEK